MGILPDGWENGCFSFPKIRERITNPAPALLMLTGLKYATAEYAFDDESDVKIWIIKNQFGRRNLSSYDRSVLALELKPLIAEKAKANQLAGVNLSQISVKGIDTQKELAKIANVSHDTISKVEKIENLATPEIKQLVKEDKITINQAEKASMLDPETQEEIAPLLEAGAKVEKLRILHNTGNNEWYTPKEYIDAARQVMGSIECYPCLPDVLTLCGIKASCVWVLPLCKIAWQLLQNLQWFTNIMPSRG